MSTLILHNGNQAIKDWAAKQLPNCIQLPCVSEPWHINGVEYVTIDDKLSALTDQQNYCTDLTASDRISYTDLIKLKTRFEFVKIVTDYEFDIQNLEPQWSFETYTRQQWSRCLISNLCLCDRLVFWNVVKLSSNDFTRNKVVFSPGHSGTHVILSILGMNPGNKQHWVHHDDDLITQPKFLDLVNTENIFSVVRKKFIGQVLSDLVTDVYGPLVTTIENLEQHKKIVASWSPIVCERCHFDAAFEKVATFADLALGLKYFYNKDIKLCYMERLISEHSSDIKFLKNPYDYPTLISNYKEISELYENTYQSAYNIIVHKLESVFGETILKNV